MSSPDHPANYLHLGDSYTCAEGIDLKDGWVRQWHERVVEQGLPIGESHILARNSWTCENLLKALRKSDLSSEWDRITICIGVNNQYQGMDPASFRLELEQLVVEAGQLLSNPPEGIVLLTIPDWGVSPFATDRDRIAIAAQIDAFNAVIRTLSIKTRSPCVDWTELSRSFAGQPEAFAPDGLHPSALQYSAWADFLAQSELGC